MVENAAGGMENSLNEIKGFSSKITPASYSREKSLRHGEKCLKLYVYPNPFHLTKCTTEVLEKEGCFHLGGKALQLYFQHWSNVAGAFVDFSFFI